MKNSCDSPLVCFFVWQITGLCVGPGIDTYSEIPIVVMQTFNELCHLGEASKAGIESGC